VQWTVLIPAKALPEAKSRLAPASADDAAHRRLVEAIRRDTMNAAACADAVARVLLVVDRGPVPPDSAIVQSAPGLNAAVVDAAEQAAQRWPQDGVAVLVGDLPALRPDELTAALRTAEHHPRAFVADRHGTGTTLLTALPGVELRPSFGPGSATRHARDAAGIAADAGLRHDVDTAEDLRAAVEIGLGRETAAAIAPAESTLRSPRRGIMGR
jgi:2-phospho-L-lactate guanylyltransferase